MRPQTYSAKIIEDLLEEKRVVELEIMRSQIGCSSSTFFRLMEQIDHYTSYNRLRRYVTLRKTPTFNQHGLWDFNAIKFSKWGGVQETVQHLIGRSPSGMAVTELENILGIRVNNQLQKLLKKNTVVRQREGRFQIYYSADKAKRKEQMRKRAEGAPKDKKLPFSRFQLIRIILALIEHYKVSSAEFLALLKSKKIKVQKKAVQWIYDKFQIEKKGSP